MKTVAFYISNHGFGHASRNIPLIEKLLKLDGNLKIIIKTHTRQIDFIRQSLSSFKSRIACYDENVDLGLILKENSYTVDRERLESELDRYISTWDERIEIEKAFLKDNDVDLVISDIVPWVFESAKQMGIESLLISNFTWAEIYKELLDKKYSDLFESYYRKADHVFEYPLAGSLNLDTEKIKKVGLCSREFDEEKVKSIRAKYKKPLVFASLGRSVDIDGEIDVEDLPYDFVYTEGIELKGANAHKLSVDTDNTHDYIKASEVVITKAGWSTASEAICARRPIIVLSRPEIKEDRNTVNNLLKLNIAKAIEFNELNKESLYNYIDEAKRLEQNYKYLDSRYTNCSEEIAEEILRFLHKEKKDE